MRVEIVIEREGERDGRDVRLVEIDREVRRDGERSKDMGGSEKMVE